MNEVCDQDHETFYYYQVTSTSGKECFWWILLEQINGEKKGKLMPKIRTSRIMHAWPPPPPQGCVWWVPIQNRVRSKALLIPFFNFITLVRWLFFITSQVTSHFHHFITQSGKLIVFDQRSGDKSLSPLYQSGKLIVFHQISSDKSLSSCSCSWLSSCVSHLPKVADSLGNLSILCRTLRTSSMPCTSAVLVTPPDLS